MANSKGDWTFVELMNDALTIVSGKTKDPIFVHIKLSCDMSAPEYGIPSSTFSSAGTKSMSALFPNCLAMQIQLDFRTEDTKTATIKTFADWITQIVKNTVAQEFASPCSVSMAVTDALHLYQPTNDNLVALGEEQDAFDKPVVVIMGNKGRLVQVGMTGIAK